MGAEQTLTIAEGRSDDRCARAVAEQHAGRAIFPVKDTRQQFDADHEHAPGPSACDELIGDRESVDETRAGRRNVERRTVAARAQLVLHERRGRRQWHVGGDRGDDDQIEIRRAQARGLERARRRLGRHVAGRLTLRRHVTLTNARALGDPGVRGLDDLLELEVGEDAFGDVVSRAQNARPGERTTNGCHRLGLSFRQASFSEARRLFELGAVRMLG